MGKFSDSDNFGVEEMSDEAYDAKQADVVSRCKCESCPTYVKSDETIGYCFPLVGTSKNIKWEKECICGTCPVYKEYQLSHTYYCTRCSQLCQEYKTSSQGGHE